jgi:Ca2+-binding EF-hand superfamily protein
MRNCKFWMGLMVMTAVAVVTADGTAAQEAKRQKAGPRRPGATEGRPSAEQLFQRLDRDGDGKLTGDEIPERLWNQLESVDSDDDGSIAPDELKKALASAAADRPGGDEAKTMVALIFQRLDKNSDGKLAKDELTGPLAERLKRADGNQDGTITKEELLAAAARLRSSGTDSGTISADGVLRMLDKNQDGQLTADELPDGVAARLKAADSNRDGTITRAELEEMLKNTPRRKGPAGSAGRANLQQMFQRADADGDGKLSRDELPSQMAERLMQADSDGDGKLSKEELTAARERLENRRSGGDR